MSQSEEVKALVEAVNNIKVTAPKKKKEGKDTETYIKEDCMTMLEFAAIIKRGDFGDGYVPAKDKRRFAGDRLIMTLVNADGDERVIRPLAKVHNDMVYLNKGSVTFLANSYKRKDGKMTKGNFNDFDSSFDVPETSA